MLKLKLTINHFIMSLNATFVGCCPHHKANSALSLDLISSAEAFQVAGDDIKIIQSTGHEMLTFTRMLLSLNY